MSSFNINISGDDLIKNNLDKIKNDVKKRVDDALNTFGLHTVADAKKNVPRDEGILAKSITFDKKQLSVEVIVASNYGAYMEFGTRKFASKYVSSLPPEWKTFAEKFKGAGGGSFEELVKRLTEWVHRKGIAGTYSAKTRRRTGKKKQIPVQDKQAAYAIAIKILREGIKPHPFLFPAVEKNKIELMKELNDIFK